MQITYDPAQISYRELLGIFWAVYDPAVYDFPRQYMSIIFYHNDEQQRLAEETKALKEAVLQGRVWTEIVPAADFHLAEAYHQKYYLRRVAVLEKEFEAIYPDINDLVSSTAAARVNGYAAGYGTEATLRAELDSLGLSPAAQEKLLEFASHGLNGACPLPQGDTD